MTAIVSFDMHLCLAPVRFILKDFSIVNVK